MTMHESIAQNSTELFLLRFFLTHNEKFVKKILYNKNKGFVSFVSNVIKYFLLIVLFIKQ